MRKIICIVLAVCCVFGTTACHVQEKEKNSNETSYAVSAEDADIWCASPTVQVLASEPADQYASVRQDKVYLDAAKNEYETAQIIISAKKDLKFTVAVSDLAHVDDINSYISSSNCSVYTQKYNTVSKNLHGNGAPVGKYPDALLPQENAIEYEQNIVTAGENGAAWLRFFIPENAKSGSYTGKAYVNIGNAEVCVDIELKVYDASVPSEITSKSLYTINSTMMSYYEMEPTSEIYSKYTEFLIAHRIAPSSITVQNELAEDGDSTYRVWAKTAFYWYERGLRTISVSPGSSTVNGYSSYNPGNLYHNLVELAIISLEKNVNLVQYAVFYDYHIDEPFYVTYTAEQVQSSIDVFNETVEKAATALELLDGFDSELGKTIIESVRNTPHVITDYYGNEFRIREPMVFEDGTAFSYEGQNVALCPKPEDYQSQDRRDQYNLVACDEKWWYTCNTPGYPYVSYHLEDTPVSVNSIGWMMAQYGITGYLYWVINYSFSEGTTPVEDPYAIADFGLGANGDGTIVYPGKMYGVDGPVGTVRLSAILDAQEDYELIKYIISEYEAAGISANSIIDRITSSVYNGSKLVGGSQEFEEARKILLTLAEACMSDAKLMIAAVDEVADENGRSTFCFEIHTSEGVELYNHDTLLREENGVYNLVCGLDDVKNYADLKAVLNGEETKLSIYLGGMQKVYGFDSISADDFTGTYTTAEFVDGILHFRFAETQKQKITINHPSLQDIGSNTASYILKLHNYGDDAEYKIFTTYADYGRVEFRSGTLAAGANEINLDTFATANWERNGKLIGLEIQITGTNEVGLYQIVVFGT